MVLVLRGRALQAEVYLHPMFSSINYQLLAYCLSLLFSIHIHTFMMPSPKVLRFRSTWGVPNGEKFGNIAKWVIPLKEQGYSGIEFNINYIDGPTPFFPDLEILRKICDDIGFEIIAQIVSEFPKTWSARPTGLGVQQHLAGYRKQLEAAKVLRPIKVNAQSGADYWSVEESVEFYKGTVLIDAELGLKVCHETHRNRALFTPYNTAKILKQIPELRVTGDFSHHVVCCERLLDQGEEDKELLNQIVQNVDHIHARIGTTQASQCPDPDDPMFAEEKAFFYNLWKETILAHAKNRPDHPITFTPEYGTYPYHPHTAKRNYEEICNTEGIRLQTLFEETLKNVP